MSGKTFFCQNKKNEELTQKGVIYVTKMKKSLNYTATSDTMYQNSDGLMEVRIQDAVHKENQQRADDCS